MPAENAGGFGRFRPIATHNRRISDFASYRSLLIISGLADAAQGEHIIRSEDGRCALWAGTVDDLWAFGAYWLRLMSDRDTTATATLLYD